jgi:hypothetical protein
MDPRTVGPRPLTARKEGVLPRRHRREAATVPAAAAEGGAGGQQATLAQSPSPPSCSSSSPRQLPRRHMQPGGRRMSRAAATHRACHQQLDSLYHSVALVRFMRRVSRVAASAGVDSAPAPPRGGGGLWGEGGSHAEHLTRHAAPPLCRGDSCWRGFVPEEVRAGGGLAGQDPPRQRSGQTANVKDLACNRL